jgi:hypothetical protein
VLIKFLVIALLFYYVARTAGNLYRAIAHDPRGQGQVPPTYQRSQRPQQPQWQGPAASRDSQKKDVEEAKWVDL